jgi:uncharacterized membrane protein YeiH
MNEVLILQLIFLLDKIGIVAFAISGVMVGLKKRLDIFGLLVVGVVTAIGGGIIRDIIVNKMPYAFINTDYLIFAIAATSIIIILYRLNLIIPSKFYLAGDTIGLGAFAVAGALVALDNNLGLLQTIILAVVTAVGGGAIRDTLVNDIPFILRKELYATVAALTGIVVYFTSFVSLPLAVILGTSFAIALRSYAIHKKLSLPKLKYSKGKPAKN